MHFVILKNISNKGLRSKKMNNTSNAYASKINQLLKNQKIHALNAVQIKMPSKTMRLFCKKYCHRCNYLGPCWCYQPFRINSHPKQITKIFKWNLVKNKEIYNCPKKMGKVHNVIKVANVITDLTDLWLNQLL